MLRFSTGLRDGVLDATGIREATANGVLRIYSGAQPASADTAVSGTLLVEVTVDGAAFAHGTATNGLNFDAPANAVLSKAAAETWRGNGLADGTAGWFRFCSNPVDSGGASSTLARIDGSVGRSAADLNLSNINILTGVPNTVDVFQISMDQG
ncbi:MAG: hypothetical protein DRQ97_09950 [Gammaproteobacteria bacterium]|nr:MAG: hypothetical protein DRQ97_09950 [Gammaproteobacteria bacterium]